MAELGAVFVGQKPAVSMDDLQNMKCRKLRFFTGLVDGIICVGSPYN